MKLERQVCSLKLAKKLKSLNVKQESLFYWNGHPHYDSVEEMQDNPETASTHIEWELEQSALMEDYETYSAFTVAELGEMLPHSIDYRWLKCTKDVSDHWDVYYEKVGKLHKSFEIEDQTADTEADARAKMLIHLLENGLIALTQGA